jgi:rhodanese-related sulfurtransferase
LLREKEESEMADVARISVEEARRAVDADGEVPAAKALRGGVQAWQQAGYPMAWSA